MRKLSEEEAKQLIPEVPEPPSPAEDAELVQQLQEEAQHGHPADAVTLPKEEEDTE